MTPERLDRQPGSSTCKALHLRSVQRGGPSEPPVRAPVVRVGARNRCLALEPAAGPRSPGMPGELGASQPVPAGRLRGSCGLSAGGIRTSEVIDVAADLDVM